MQGAFGQKVGKSSHPHIYWCCQIGTNLYVDGKYVFSNDPEFDPHHYDVYKAKNDLYDTGADPCYVITPDLRKENKCL